MKTKRPFPFASLMVARRLYGDLLDTICRLSAELPALRWFGRRRLRRLFVRLERLESDLRWLDSLRPAAVRSAPYCAFPDRSPKPCSCSACNPSVKLGGAS